MANVNILTCVYICLICVIISQIQGFIPRSCTSATSSRLPEPTQQNARLEGHVFLRTEVAGAYWCARRCLQQRKCLSFNYHQEMSVCQLNSDAAENTGQTLLFSPGVVYYERHVLPQYIIGSCSNHTCHPESVCQPEDHISFTCECQNPALSGNNCSATVVSYPCASDPCESGGTCYETSAGFECMCAPGFAGNVCDITVCPEYTNISLRASVQTQMVNVSWRNDIEDAVDVYIVMPAERDSRQHPIVDMALQERWQFSVPAAAQRKWKAYVDTLWVARDRQSHHILPMDNGCSFVVPHQEETITIITAK